VLGGTTSLGGVKRLGPSVSGKEGRCRLNSPGRGDTSVRLFQAAWLGQELQEPLLSKGVDPSGDGLVAVGPSIKPRSGTSRFRAKTAGGGRDGRRSDAATSGVGLRW